MNTKNIRTSVKLSLFVCFIFGLNQYFLTSTNESAMNKKPIVLFFFLFALYSCNDSESFNPDDNYFKASAFVEVVDLAGHPLANVAISTVRTTSSGVFESVYGTTNAEGVLQVKNIFMFPSTYFTASKPGYFQGSRRIYPVAGKTHFIKIILLDAVDSGSFDASVGGIIQVQDQVSLHFPPDAIVSKNGNLYSGEVRVNAEPIAADDNDLLFKMPGDLVGLNNSGNKVALGSFGMVAIELRSPWNELLNIKEGKTVEMKMKVPDHNLSKAPSNIPMWYFNETAGYWKEDGSASLEGNEYVAQLPHFSFWNCDDWREAVKWGATLVYDNGAPVSQVCVNLTILSLESTGGGVTNEDGFVSGIVPANEILRLDIKSPCGSVVYSKELGPYTEDINNQSIVIPTTDIYLTKLSGNAVNCNDAPLTNGFARIKGGGSGYYYAPIDAETGYFSMSMMACQPADLTLKVFDVKALKESPPLTFPYATQIDAGSIQVCKDLTEFIDLEAVGTSQHFHFYYPYAYSAAGYIVMGTLDSLQTQICSFLVPADAIGTYPSDQSQVGLTFSNGNHLSGTGIVVTFTEFGEAGNYLKGTITGTLRPDPGGQGGSNEYPLSGTFAILRQ